MRYPHIESFACDDDRFDELDNDVECAVKYAGYIERQKRDIEAVRRMEEKEIPITFPYAELEGLSTEARQKLMTKRPETVAQASRISGVRASDLSIIVVHLERRTSSHGHRAHASQPHR